MSMSSRLLVRPKWNHIDDDDDRHRGRERRDQWRKQVEFPYSDRTEDMLYREVKKGLYVVV